MGVEPHKQRMADLPHTTPEHTDDSQRETNQLLEELAQHVDESDPTTIDAHPDFDTLDDYNPDTPLTGRVAAWFSRQPHGGVHFGGLCSQARTASSPAQTTTTQTHSSAPTSLPRPSAGTTLPHTSTTNTTSPTHQVPTSSSPHTTTNATKPAQQQQPPPVL